MSTKTTLADEFAGILCDRDARFEERYSLVVEEVTDALDEFWDTVFGPWLDTVQARVTEKLQP